VFSHDTYVIPPSVPLGLFGLKIVKLVLRSLSLPSLCVCLFVCVCVCVSECVFVFV
jgi:hypothetical protein